MPRPRSVPFQSRRRWTSGDARAALSALSASGLSVAAFAAREGLDAQRLYRWRRQLAALDHAPQPAPAFVEIRQGSDEPVEVVLRNGRVLRVSERIAAASLERLVLVLEKVSSC